MRVTPETLGMHLEELKRHFDIVSLTSWVKAHQQGKQLPRHACAITFDDGWLDNFEYALPLLKAHRVPATLFAVAEKIGTDFQFWPNIVAALLLEGAGHQMVEDRVLGVPGIDQTGRSPERIAACIKKLKVYTDRQIFDALDNMHWRQRLSTPMSPALMSWAQLREMQASGWVDIGSHTCTHQRLTTALSSSELEREIVESRVRLERELGTSVNLFCFPNGDYSAQALSLVKAHYDAAVTTQKGINRPRSNGLHELVRVGVHNDISDTRRRFNARLSGWL